jgi:hypothetical protein
MIKALTYWLIRNAISKTYDIYQFLIELPFVLTTKSPDYASVIAELESNDAERLAVVAPHPTNALKFTLRNLVDALVENNYAVVVLTYRVSDLDWLRREFPNVIVASRCLRGRDFGAWKYFLLAVLGSDRLKHRLSGLVLANDSMYYNKQGANEFVKYIRESKKHWACVYENNEIHYHAQSFFLGFSGFAINNNKFLEFWKGYRPYSSRRHSINKGEVQFSAKMKKAFGMPDCYVSSGRLLCAMEGMSEKKTITVLDALSRGRDVGSREFDEIYKIAGEVPFVNGLYTDRPNLDLVKRLMTDFVVWQKEAKNPTHGIGLVANQLLGIPIKRDICYRGAYRMAHVLKFCFGYSADEICEMDEDLRQKGVPESIVGIKRVLFLMGRL